MEGADLDLLAPKIRRIKPVHDALSSNVDIWFNHRGSFITGPFSTSLFIAWRQCAAVEVEIGTRKVPASRSFKHHIWIDIEGILDEHGADARTQLLNGQAIEDIQAGNLHGIFWLRTPLKRGSVVVQGHLVMVWITDPSRRLLYSSQDFLHSAKFSLSNAQKIMIAQQ